MSDRVLVMSYGRLVAELSGPNMTKEGILRHCYALEHTEEADANRAGR
jgi:ABC-type sugar transport system ATPase subunit